MKIRVHKIASVVYRAGFQKDVEVTDQLEVKAGNALVVRALREKRVYSDLELENGRMAKIFRGDIFIGALGRRRALRGFCGELPSSLRVGDRVQLLNRGGVLGSSSTQHMDFGEPVSCEVLGMPIRSGRIVSLADDPIARQESLAGLDLPPVFAVSGTCMNSGKTLLLSELIQELSSEGMSIAGGKITGIACLRDLVAMEDHGASGTASFLDAGYPSTVGLDAPELAVVAKTIIAYLGSPRPGTNGRPDLVVLEFGDGVIGDYGGLEILTDPEIRAAVRMHAFCASDLVGAWGGKKFLDERGIGIDLFSGPCTDNLVGMEYLENELGVAAMNAHKNPEALAKAVRRHLDL